MTMATIMIIGCGRLGHALGARLAAGGHPVIGVRRHPPPGGPVSYLAADITDPGQVARLPADVDAVVFMAAADSRDQTAYAAIYRHGLGHLLRRLGGQPWLLVSSTSVYGQNGGEWVDEDSPAMAEAATSRLIAEAERRLWADSARHVVVRFAGIYGPGRGHLLRLATQSPELQRSPPYYSNRIHQRDGVGVLELLLARRLAGLPLDACYLAADDCPAPQWEVVSWLAAQMRCPPPRAKAAAADAPQNKRCLNARLKALGYGFEVPDYQAGYRELLGDGQKN